LLALGTLSAEAVRTFGAGGSHFKDVDSLLQALRPHLDGATTVLVKGSRFMRMERVVRALKGEALAVPGGAS
jgi:UDP-N-acetylmuramyl pentapeptide synthase